MSFVLGFSLNLCLGPNFSLRLGLSLGFGFCSVLVLILVLNLFLDLVSVLTWFWSALRIRPRLEPTLRPQTLLRGIGDLWAWSWF